MNNLDIIKALTIKELKVRYKNNALGYLWSLANPLAHAFVYFSVFGIIMKVKVEDFSLFLICGLFPWQWISNSAGVAPMTFLGNASLVKKVNFPRNYLPLVVTLQDGIHFLISIPVIILFMSFYDKYPTIEWIYLIPLMLMTQLVFTYSLGLIISTVNIFFRDMEKIIQIMLTFLFYFTPVVYKVEMIPEQYKGFELLNPAAPIVISWKQIFLSGSVDFKYLASSITWTLVLYLLSSFLYKRTSWRFAEVL